jgi:3-hydroxyphenylacetate 6-hydroxylase
VSNIDGPRGLPIVGNLTQLKPNPAEKLRGWANQYGGVCQIMMGNEPVVVFNSMEAAKNVFIGHGGALVDQPQFYTFHRVLSKTAASFGTMPWNSRL